MAPSNKQNQQLEETAPEHFENLFLNGNLVGGDDDDEREFREMAAGGVNNNHENASNSDNNNNTGEQSCWVFGYGSLCWYPGFEFSKCITGYIKGYVRRMWQGNTTHRGTDEKPGRVATLIEEPEGITWGCAYKITGNTALEYLKQRECTLGGYATLDTKFFPRIASYDTPFSGEAIEVLVYIATVDNRLWLGEDHPQKMAEQIVECSGPSGHNVEYLLRLAAFMHDEIPGVMDEHLFELEQLVIDELHKRQIPLWTVMGANPARIRRDSHQNIKRPPSFEFTSRIAERKLRCLNI